MKKTMLVVAGLIISLAASAQKVKEADVPANVKEAFIKKYPGSKAEWEKEGSDYEAEFKLNKVETSAAFNASGIFLEAEQEIKTSELPKSITEYCTKNYVGYKLDEASKITDAAEKVWYEAELEKGKENIEAIFDEKGNFVKKSEESGKEDDKD